MTETRHPVVPLFGTGDEKADAPDMTKGRSLLAIEAGHMNIPSLSAVAIDAVEVKKGKTEPVRVTVRMQNAAGLFQLDDLLKKLKNSRLECCGDVSGDILGESDKRLLGS